MIRWDEALDAHVGEATTTVEDVTQLEPEAAPSTGRLPTIQSAPAQSSTSLSPTAALEHSKAPARNTPSPTSLHQMVRQVCEAVGETWRNSLQQHIQSSLTALGPPPQPLHSGPKPQVPSFHLHPPSSPPFCTANSCWSSVRPAVPVPITYCTGSYIEGSA